MTGPPGDPDLWRELAAIGFLILLAAALSAVRLTLSRASRPPPSATDGEEGAGRGASPVRARVLGGLTVGTILLNTAASVLAALRLAAGPAADANAAALAIALVSGAIVLAEAAAHLAVRTGAVAQAFGAVGIRLDRYARALSARDEFRGRIDRMDGDSDVVRTERQMLGGLLDLGEMTVSEVMVHRTKMRAVDGALPLPEMIREVLASPHTRFPVWRGEPDNIVGLLHAKDLFRAMERRPGAAVFDVEAVATPPWFVPDTTSLRDQLAAFLSRKQHFALVVDEYGDLMGLVTLEDILEEIVGDIADEHDVSVRGVRAQPDGSLLVDGSVPIRDLNRMTGWSVPDDEATTVAGFVIHEAQAIPEPGQVFTFGGFRIEVLRRVRNRLTALRIAPVAPASVRDRPAER